MILFILFVMWWVIGFSGYIFWESANDDVRLASALFGLLFVSSILGPFTWLCGFLLYGEPLETAVVFKKRVLKPTQDDIWDQDRKSGNPPSAPANRSAKRGR